MTAQIRRQQEFDSSLNILRREGLLFVISDQLRSFQSYSLKHVCYEGVEDVHAFSGNSNIVGNALEDFEDVQRKALEILLSVFGCNGLSCHDYLLGLAFYIYRQILIFDFIGWFLGAGVC